MQTERIIPILRIFDEAKAMEFYIDWLEFTIDWTHRFEQNSPLYMQISKGNMVIHLSEHHGDSVPGIKLFIPCKEGLEDFQKMLLDKKYKYYRPGLERAFWNAVTMEVGDPFGNKLLFSQDLSDDNVTL